MNDVHKFLEQVTHRHGFFKWLSASPFEAVATSTQKSSPPTVPSRPLPRDTIKVFDVSGSMGSPDYPPTRLDGGIHAAIEYVDARVEQCPDDRIAVISFNDTAHVVLPLTPISHRETIFRAIRCLTAGGGTDIAEGLRVVVELFDNEPQSDRQRHVNLLTDGQGGKPLRIASRLKEKYGVVIDVVRIGGSTSDVNESLIRKVATTDPDGFCHYHYIKDTETLSEHYRQLAKSFVWRGGNKRQRRKLTRY